jgi:hypothetical protein
MQNSTVLVCILSTDYLRSLPRGREVSRSREKESTRQREVRAVRQKAYELW